MKETIRNFVSFVSSVSFEICQDLIQEVSDDETSA